MHIHHLTRSDARVAGLLLAALSLTFAGSGTASAAICRVTVAGTGANNGSDWGSPMDLQTA